MTTESTETKMTTDTSTTMSKTGLRALLTPKDSVLLLIDHQPFQFANLHSHESTMVVNNVIGLAKTAKLFGVPTILTTVVEERGGFLIKGLQDVFPEQKPINRTFINTWEDSRVVDAIKKTGRKKVVMAALWTEICLAMPAIQAMGEGYEGVCSDGCIWRRLGPVPISVLFFLKAVRIHWAPDVWTAFLTAPLSCLASAPHEVFF